MASVLSRLPVSFLYEGMESTEGETGHWLAAVVMRRAPSLGVCRAACQWWLSAAFLPFFVFFLLVSPPGLATSQLRHRQSCSICRGIADRFRQGLTDTAKKNFGGGNTAWEEKTLNMRPVVRSSEGTWETEKKTQVGRVCEIRLVEIIENLCDNSNFGCNNMVEEHEENIEAWWFKWRKINIDLFKWLCIEKIEVCCPSGTYGPDCLACLGGSERPCHGNGRCDGDGTRGGDGSCICNKEYKGEFCLECTDGYYNSHRNDTHSVCTACHDSCKTCRGAANTDWQDCKEGWTKNKNACVDVDECAAEDSPCSSDQYCLNTNGSFSCKACDISCFECTAEGPGKCKNCIAGYEMEDEKCTDVNECSLPEKVCVRENEDCVNTPGGFKCICAEGFENKDGACAPVIKTEEAASENTSSPATHEVLCSTFQDERH